MTKKEQVAKIKEMEEWIKNGVPVDAKDPSSKADDFYVGAVDMKPGKVLEVVNGNEVRTNLSDAAVKVSDGGYYEMNKKDENEHNI